MLKVQNLKKHFGGIKAVDNCSFEIKKNKITALIGPNGSGKSTVFNLISGVLETESGNIIFDKKEITNLSPDKISNLGISRIFQQSRLFNNLTIKENMVLALNNDDMKFWKSFFSKNRISKQNEEKIKDILKLFKMNEHEGKYARNLSFGQKRLVEISRAIIKPHKLLMLDEPVAGVTPALRKELSQALLKLKKQGETIFVIEHDMDFILNLADEVIVMDEGKVIAKGKPSEIKNNKQVLEAYLGD
ncbi:MAG: ABC transporter ATP-binding protein [Candidatus Pacearchaeota archaeon]|jgi:branched-chain amino acid transport system ATP-binding protein/neutral amino acid transport system ATP-binding protein